MIMSVTYDTPPIVSQLDSEVHAVNNMAYVSSSSRRALRGILSVDEAHSEQVRYFLQRTDPEPKSFMF